MFATLSDRLTATFKSLRGKGRLTEADVDKLTIGQEMELVIETLGEDAEGNEIVSYAFAPVDQEVSA